MDGNGRWAQTRNKPRVFGHKNGVKAVRNAVQFSMKTGIKALTLFAFSSENWKRPEQEVSTLMELFLTVLGSEVSRLHKNGIRLKIVGDCSRFSKKIRERIEKAETLTANNTAMQLNIAANYGGRWDIAQACQELAKQIEAGTLQASQVNESLIAEHICLSELPELDLLIRTGGDHRISNFLLWQAAYAELYFTDVLWPDFSEQTFAEAVEVFAGRERRFGCTGEQVKQLLQQQ